MHRDTQNDGRVEDESSRATHTEHSQRSAVGMPIVPVKLYHSSNPERYVKVFAMLDPCSTGTFILQQTLDEL